MTGEIDGRVFVANGLPRKGLATGTLISPPGPTRAGELAHVPLPMLVFPLQVMLWRWRLPIPGSF